MDARPGCGGRCCSDRTASKWLRRYRGGDRELGDRSSRPRHSPNRLSDECVRVIEALRRLRMTAAEIAEILRLPLSTVSAWLKRIGLGTRSRLEPPEPPNRYERRHPASSCTSTSRSSAASAAPATGSTGSRATQAKTRRAGAPTRGLGLGVRARHGRRPLTPCLRGSAQRPHRSLRRRLPRTRGCLVRRARGDGQGAHERQRLLLHRVRVRRRARRARLASPAHQARQATHERQGRTLHPDAAPRVGIRTGSTAAQTNAPPHSPPTSSATTSGDHTAPSATKCRPRG